MKTPHGGGAFGTTKVDTAIVPNPLDTRHAVRTAWNYTLKDDPREFVIFCPVAATYQEALLSIQFRFGENVVSVYGGDSDA